MVAGAGVTRGAARAARAARLATLCRPGLVVVSTMQSRTTTYSFTRLSTFAQCRRQYELRYLLRKPDAFVSAESHLGTAVHATLAWLYEGDRGDGAGVRTALLERFRGEWRRRLTPRVRVIREEARLEDYARRGEALLERHFSAGYRQDRLETLHLEWSFRLTLGERTTFTGIADRVVRHLDGTIGVIDYKTTARPPTKIKPHAALQLRGYAAGVMESLAAERVALSLQFLEDGSVLRSEVGLADLPGIHAELQGKIEAVEESRTFSASPSALCRWCGVNAHCEEGRAYLAGREASASASACPECGAPLQVRHGSRGPFVGCTGYPECRFTRGATAEERAQVAAATEGGACPLCGGELERREGRRGPFLGCGNFPACRFARDL